MKKIGAFFKKAGWILWAILLMILAVVFAMLKPKSTKDTFVKGRDILMDFIKQLFNKKETENIVIDNNITDAKERMNNRENVIDELLKKNFLKKENIQRKQK